MQGRYKIIKNYFGKFNEKMTICVTDSLFEAVTLCKDLKKAYYGRPFIFDFEKLAPDLDEGLDFYPGESFLDIGVAYDCKNMTEFKKQHKKQKRRKSNETNT